MYKLAVVKEDFWEIYKLKETLKQKTFASESTSLLERISDFTNSL